MSQKLKQYNQKLKEDLKDHLQKKNLVEKLSTQKISSNHTIKKLQLQINGLNQGIAQRDHIIKQLRNQMNSQIITQSKEEINYVFYEYDTFIQEIQAKMYNLVQFIKKDQNLDLIKQDSNIKEQLSHNLSNIQNEIQLIQQEFIGMEQQTTQNENLISKILNRLQNLNQMCLKWCTERQEMRQANYFLQNRIIQLQKQKASDKQMLLVLRQSIQLLQSSIQVFSKHKNDLIYTISELRSRLRQKDKLKNKIRTKQ